MPKKKIGKTKSDEGVFNLILENNVTLQKNLIETLEELKKLNLKMTEVLDIFDKAGKTFEESLEKGTGNDLIELEKKLSILIDQNKVLAKGLLLLERSVRPETFSGRRASSSRESEEESEEGSEESF